MSLTTQSAAKALSQHLIIIAILNYRITSVDPKVDNIYDISFFKKNPSH